METSPLTKGRRVVIASCSLVDGTGQPMVPADIYVEDARIQRVCPPRSSHGTWKVLDGEGLVVTPGFIDVHSHADNAPLLTVDDTTKILQGVTTEIVGNCGFSLAPITPGYERRFVDWAQQLFPHFRPRWHTLGEYLALTDARKYVVNYVPLVGHGALRLGIGHPDSRELGDRDMCRLVDRLDESLAAGAFGLSSGLAYTPGSYSTAAELEVLAHQLAPDRVYACHVRDQGDLIEESIDEVLRLGEAAGCRVQVSHHKVTGARNWGKSVRTLEMLGKARARGLRVCQDMYPYTSTSTVLSAVLPPEFRRGTTDDVIARLRDPWELVRLRNMLTSGESSVGWKNPVATCGWRGVLVAASADRRFEGQTIASVAEASRSGDPVEALAGILCEERLEVTAFFVDEMSEDDVVRVLEDSNTMIGSDGLPPGRPGLYHPRIAGSFVRVLGRYVREGQVLSWAEAVRRMTGLPAMQFGIPERGLVRAGWFADLVAFHRETVGDAGDFGEPLVPPRGIEWVMMAGRMVVHRGSYQRHRVGRRLHPGR